MHISKYLFQLAKSPLGDFIVGVAFGNLSALLPVNKIAETHKAIAFWHPKPFWEKHILIVPKHPIKSLLNINETNSEYLTEMYTLLQTVIHKLKWENEEYSTLINGGKRQEVGQIHMHVFSGREVGEQNKQTADISVKQKVIDYILDIYPFLTVEEKNKFIEDSFSIKGTTEIAEVEQVFNLLNNRHAGIIEHFVKSNNHYTTPNTRPSNYSPSLPYKTLFGNILYIDLPKLSDDPDIFAKTLETEIFNDVKRVNGIVIDVRKNGGGNESLGFLIAEYFLPKGTYIYGVNKKKGTDSLIIEKNAVYTSENDNPVEVPIVILISEDTGSSAERFVALMKCLPNVTLIGSDTWGGSANPRKIEITADNKVYTVLIPTWRFFLSNSNLPLEESKIKPDIYMDPKNPNLIENVLKYMSK